MVCRGRDSSALGLLGDCHLAKKQFDQALEAYKRSLEAHPRQPSLALKVVQLLVRQTKNLDSAAIWIRKAEQINQGSLELYQVRKVCLVKLFRCELAQPIRSFYINFFF